MRGTKLLVSIIMILTLLAGAIPLPTKAIEGAASRGKIIIVIAPKDFQEVELNQCRKVFDSRGFEVTIASTTTEPAIGMSGRVELPEVTISQIDLKDYLALVIIGGSGAKTYLWDNAQLHQVVKQADEEGIVVAAICLAPGVLARAGILDGKEATVYPEAIAIAELEKGGAIFTDQPVVISDNIVTGRDPRAAKLFAIAIVQSLSK
jgi:protease I